MIATSGDLASLYRAELLDHWANPRNWGRLAGANVIKAEAANPLCGDEVTFYLRLPRGIVSNVRFEGEGCAISQASASLFSDYIKGREKSELLELTPKDILSLLQITLTPVRLRCALLPLEAVKFALSGAPSFG